MKITSPLQNGRLPLWIKIFHSVFLCVLVPAYWRQYGPVNFLWFSDIALLVTLFALWFESPLMASMQAVAVTALEFIWNIDYFGQLLFGIKSTGMSSYMFDDEIPLFIRALSLFHVWIPFQLLWITKRLGYDHRGWLIQTMIAWMVLPVCYFLTDAQLNINWVFGLGDTPQTTISPLLYLVALMLLFPCAIYLPTHLVLKRFLPARGTRRIEKFAS